MRVAVVTAIIGAVVTAVASALLSGAGGLVRDAAGAGHTTGHDPVPAPTATSTAPISQATTDPSETSAAPSSAAVDTTPPTDETEPPATTSESIPQTPDESASEPELPAGPVPAITVGIQTEGGSGSWDFQDSATVNGDLRSSVLWVCADLVNGNGLNCAHDHNVSWAELTLSRQYRQFTALLAFADKSATACSVAVRVLVDNQPVLSRDIRYGQYDNIKLGLTNHLKLRVEARFKAGGLCFLDFADATYTPR